LVQPAFSEKKQNSTASFSQATFHLKIGFSFQDLASLAQSSLFCKTVVECGKCIFVVVFYSSGFV
jgi:hypothetical protein